jgi:hypothetical protein
LAFFTVTVVALRALPRVIVGMVKSQCRPVAVQIGLGRHNLDRVGAGLSLIGQKKCQPGGGHKDMAHPKS